MMHKKLNPYCSVLLAMIQLTVIISLVAYIYLEKQVMQGKYQHNQEEKKDKQSIYVIGLGQPITKESCITISGLLGNGLHPILYTGKLFDVSEKKLGAHNFKKEKPAIYQKVLEHPKIKEDDVVVFVDLYDTFFICDSEELLRKFSVFEKLNKKRVIFGAEMYFWPFNSGYDCPPFNQELVSNLYEERIGKTRKVPYLNSGIFLGRKQHLREFLSIWVFKQKVAYNRDLCKEDQGCATLAALENSLWVSIDINNEIVLNAFKVKRNALNINTTRDGISVFDTRTNSFPSIVHFNGDGGQDSDCFKYQAFYTHYFEKSFKENKWKDAAFLNSSFYLDNDITTFGDVCMKLIQ